jgi:hypothetical protein
MSEREVNLMLDLGGSVGLTEPVAHATLQKESQNALPPQKKRSLPAIPIEVAVEPPASLTWRDKARQQQAVPRSTVLQELSVLTPCLGAVLAAVLVAPFLERPAFSGSTRRSVREAFVSFQHEALHYILPSRCLTA